MDHGKPRQLIEIMTASNVGLGRRSTFDVAVSPALGLAVSSRSFLTLNHFQIALTMYDFHDFGLILAGQCTVCLKG